MTANVCGVFALSTRSGGSKRSLLLVFRETLGRNIEDYEQSYVILHTWHRTSIQWTAIVRSERSYEQSLRFNKYLVGKRSLARVNYKKSLMKSCGIHSLFLPFLCEAGLLLSTFLLVPFDLVSPSLCDCKSYTLTHRHSFTTHIYITRFINNHEVGRNHRSWLYRCRVCSPRWQQDDVPKAGT